MRYLRDIAIGLFVTFLLCLLYIEDYARFTIILPTVLIWWGYIACKMWVEIDRHSKYEIKMFSTYLYDKGNPDTDVNKDLQEEYNNGWEIAGNIERIAGSTTVKLLIPLKRKMK